MNTGTEIYKIKKNERVDIIFSFSEFRGVHYLNVFQRLKPQFIDEGRDGVVGRLTFNIELFPEFIAGIEEVKEALELYRKGYRETRTEAWRPGQMKAAPRDAMDGGTDPQEETRGGSGASAGCREGGRFYHETGTEDGPNSANSN